MSKRKMRICTVSRDAPFFKWARGIVEGCWQFPRFLSDSERVSLPFHHFNIIYAYVFRPRSPE